MKNDSNESKTIDLRTDKDSNPGIHDIPPNSNEPRPYAVKRERHHRPKLYLIVFLIFIIMCPLIFVIIGVSVFSTGVSTHYSGDEQNIQITEMSANNVDSRMNEMTEYSYTITEASNTILSEAFSIRDVKELDIDLSSTSVNFFRNESNKIEINWYSNMSKEDLEAKIELSDNKLTIAENTEKSFGEQLSSYIEIYIPYIKMNDININTVYGYTNFNLDVFTENLYIDSVAGQIQMGSISSPGDIFINSTSSDFNCSDLTANNFTFNSVYGNFNSNSVICDGLDVKTTSSLFNPISIYCQNASIETVSGEMNITTIVSDTLLIKTTSSSIRLTPSVKNITLNTVSGIIELINPGFDNIKADTVSGDFYLTDLENDEPFKLTATTVTGSVQNNYSNTDNNADRSVNFNSISGSLFIN